MWPQMPAKSVKETICAIATPPGSGALGVIRVSGPKALEILSNLWRGPVPVEKFKPRTLYLGNISVFPNPQSGPIDRVLAVFMPAPATYTGEDVVELSAHGSPVVLREILSACVSGGARPAMPGEFTRRAFMAGKIDLAQAEGVADLIAATGERGARLAAEQMDGRLSREVTSIGEEIASVRAEIEAAIDFPEEDVDAGGGKPVVRRVAEALSKVDALGESFREGKLLREGVRVAIVGRPNAGKSSVMNCIAGRERAIVHHVPGTTRDVVEEKLSFGGLAFNLRDTAGLREEAGEVEEMGIARTLREIEEADLVLAVVDGSLPVDEECAKMFSKLDARRTVVVLNKSDLPRACLCEEKLAELGFSPPLFTSAKSGDGMTELAAELLRRANLSSSEGEGAVITSARHKALLDEASSSLAQARISLEAGEPSEFCAHHMREAQEALGKITGAVTTDDLLDRIFSRFCIGK